MASIHLAKTLVPLPTTTRNFGTHLEYDAETNRIAYSSGKSAIVRSLDSELIIQFTGHGAANVTVVRFSPVSGSNCLCSGDESGKVVVWEHLRSEEGGIETKVRAEFQVLAGPVTDISWDFEGRRLCVVGEGRDKFGAFISWDTGNSLGEVTGHSQRINACHIRQQRPMRAATAGDDGSVVFYKGPPFQFVRSDRIHHVAGKFVRDICFSPDGKYLVSVGSDRKIVLYDGVTGEFIKYIGDQAKIGGGLFAVAWVCGAEDPSIVTAGADGTVHLWDVDANKMVRQWVLGDGPEYQQVGLLVTKNQDIVSLSLNGILNMVNINGDRPIRKFEGHNKGITALALNPLVTASYDGRVVEWSEDDVPTTAGTHKNRVTSIDNVEGRTSTISWDNTLKVSDEVQFSFSEQPQASFAYKGSVAVITTSNRLVLLDSLSGSLVREKTLQKTPSALTLGANYVAVGYEGTNSVEVFRVADFDNSFELPTAMRGTPSTLSLSPSGRYLAVGDIMGKILLFDLEQKSVKTSRWSFHTGKITSMSWRPEEKEEDHIATASLDTNIFIYSVKRPMKVSKKLNAHKDGINFIGWESPETIVSAGQDACIKRWSVNFP